MFSVHHFPAQPPMGLKFSENTKACGYLCVCKLGTPCALRLSRQRRTLETSGSHPSILQMRCKPSGDSSCWVLNVDETCAVRKVGSEKFLDLSSWSMIWPQPNFLPPQPAASGPSISGCFLQQTCFLLLEPHRKLCLLPRVGPVSALKSLICLLCSG